MGSSHGRTSSCMVGHRGARRRGKRGGRGGERGRGMAVGRRKGRRGTMGGLLGELGPQLVHEPPVGDCCLVRAVCRKKEGEEGEKKKKKGKEKRRKIKIKFFQPKNFQGEK
jgi:hypothetical protein